MLYFDNAATTIPSTTALEKAQVFITEKFFNPSALYSGGLNCAKEIKVAKEELNSNDNDRIVKATEKLSNESQAIFGKIYQQANPNGDPNADGGANGGDTEFHQ